jgi:hypothetical protein
MKSWFPIVIAGCLFATGNGHAQTNESISRINAQIDSLNKAIAEISMVKDRVSGIDERLTTSENDLAGLKKLKVSGYLQARFEYLDYENFSDGATTTTNKYGTKTTSINGSQGQSDFYIRRGRIKFTYTPNTTSEYVIYFDGSKDKVSLKEAYVKLTEPWTKKGMASVTIGQMNWPFGVEIERSSSTREVPERSLLARTLFPGERDRGMKLTVNPLKKVSLDLGVYNGWGIDNSTYTWQDPTKQKDFIGRVKYDMGIAVLTASYYNGEAYVAKSVTQKEDGTSSTKPEHRYYKGRIGCGIEGYYQFLPFGGSALLAEVVNGNELGKNVFGGYALLVQNVSSKLGFALRGETYDSDTDYDYGQTFIFTPAVNYWWDDAVRLTLAYDVINTNYDSSMGKKDPSKTNADPRDNKLTAQFQFKF